MNGREIPGFYYDDEKNKYFKIQANHLVSAGAKHSRENVNKQKRHTQEVTERTKRIKLEEQQLIKRAGILRNPTISGIALHRELASCHLPDRPLESRLQAYGRGLEEQGVWDAPLREGTIDSFVWDDTLRCAVYSAREGSRNNHMGSLTFPAANPVYASRMQESRHDKTRPREALSADLMVRPRSRITSVSLSSANIAMATVFGDATRAAVHLVTLSNPQPDTAALNESTVIYERRDEESIWTSSANPFLCASESLFAVGMSSQVVLYAAGHSRWSDAQALRRLPGDAFSIDWLSASSLAVGQRGGYITLWDTRSDGSALRLRHPSNVTGLRCVDANMLVACGIQDALAMYDLRMPRVGSPDKSLPASQAVVRYAYKNRDVPGRGFDVDARHGLVAAVDGQNAIQLYSLQTGASLSLPPFQTAASLWPPAVRPPVSCLQFTEMGGEDVLLASRGGRLVALRW